VYSNKPVKKLHGYKINRINEQETFEFQLTARLGGGENKEFFEGGVGDEDFV
jgi:hypothetical protein